jgi:hypothetical protein
MTSVPVPRADNKATVTNAFNDPDSKYLREHGLTLARDAMALQGDARNTAVAKLIDRFIAANIPPSNEAHKQLTSFLSTSWSTKTMGIENAIYNSRVW